MSPLYESLSKTLVPVRGRCDTTHGELLRAVSNVYYDVYNNGGCNLENHRYAIEVIREWRDEIVDQMPDPSAWKPKRPSFPSRVNELCSGLVRLGKLWQSNDEFMAQFADDLEEVTTSAVRAVNAIVAKTTNPA